MSGIYDGVTYVIPCSARKAGRPMPAADLYAGPMFRGTLTAAEALARWDRDNGRDARILVLSALHGLVELDQVLAPYDCKMGAPGSITPALLAGQAWRLGIRSSLGDDSPGHATEVYALCPAAYYDVLSDALQRLDVYPQDCYEATRGIGEQRKVNRIVRADGDGQAA